MHINEFDFKLPKHLIAQQPIQKRTDAKLLIGNKLIDDTFNNLTNYLHAGDILVLNNTKVIAARLFAKKMTGGRIELIINKIIKPHLATSMIKASHSPKLGDTIILENKSQAKIIAVNKTFYTLQFDNNVLQLVNNFGHMPLPPYIKRVDNVIDREKYQSVFAKNLGAVAAPTASLHFDNILLKKIKQKGIIILYLTLHVGPGTFLPVVTNDIAKHKMHKEKFIVSAKTVATIVQAKKNNQRIIAVGTTVVRALETIFRNNYQNLDDETDIFIYPPFDFKLVDSIITNFHLPKSTLLMLVSAFVGTDNIKKIYKHAINNNYRFFSYGDAMLLDKLTHPNRKF